MFLTFSCWHRPEEDDLEVLSFAPMFRLRESGREGGDAIFYTDSEKVGVAWTGGKRPWMAQK